MYSLLVIPVLSATTSFMVRTHTDIKKIITIGLAYSFQRINQIPADKYDVKLDFIVTNEKK